MEYKSYTPQLKEISEGRVVATLAQKGVVDRDNNVLVDGLVGGRQIVAVKPAHEFAHVNLGVAEVYETPTTLEASMLYNMEIPSARDWFSSTKFSYEHGHNFSYSFAFEPLEHDRGVHQSSGKSVRFLRRIFIAEASPVLIPASIGSGTLSIKAQAVLSPEDQSYEQQYQRLLADIAADIAAERAADPSYQAIQRMGKQWEAEQAARQSGGIIPFRILES